MQQWAYSNKSLRIVDDQFGSPTWCSVLAEITALLIARSGRNPQGWLESYAGMHHLAGRGTASRYQFAKAILDLDP
jgi:dTDP-4-dehydrorhamnose reductase